MAGTVYNNSMGVNLLCSLTVTLNSTLITLSWVKAEVSMDGINWVQYAFVQVGGIVLNNVGQQVFVQVPSGWYYRFTTQNAALGTLVAVG